MLNNLTAVSPRPQLNLLVRYLLVDPFERLMGSRPAPDLPSADAPAGEADGQEGPSRHRNRQVITRR